MKLPILGLLSILPFIAAQADEGLIDHGTRFLADRNVRLAELRRHATPAAGLWTALNGIVYDLSKFQHPGGANRLAQVGGIESDALYAKGVSKGDHPSLAAALTYPGIVRIGPLFKGPLPTMKPTTMRPTTTTTRPTTRRPTTRSSTTRRPTTRRPTTRRPTTRRPTTKKPSVNPEPNGNVMQTLIDEEDSLDVDSNDRSGSNDRSDNDEDGDE
jgi:hypothetical protein